MTDERRERIWLWKNHGCDISSLYGDDGEMQCPCFLKGMDFKRTPLPELRDYFTKVSPVLKSIPTLFEDKDN